MKNTLDSNHLRGNELDVRAMDASWASTGHKNSLTRFRVEGGMPIVDEALLFIPERTPSSSRAVNGSSNGCDSLSHDGIWCRIGGDGS